MSPQAEALCVQGLKSFEQLIVGIWKSKCSFFAKALLSLCSTANKHDETDRMGKSVIWLVFCVNTAWKTWSKSWWWEPKNLIETEKRFWMWVCLFFDHQQQNKLFTWVHMLEAQKSWFQSWVIWSTHITRFFWRTTKHFFEPHSDCHDEKVWRDWIMNHKSSQKREKFHAKLLTGVASLCCCMTVQVEDFLAGGWWKPFGCNMQPNQLKWQAKLRQMRDENVDMRKCFSVWVAPVRQSQRQKCHCSGSQDNENKNEEQGRSSVDNFTESIVHSAAVLTKIWWHLIWQPLLKNLDLMMRKGIANLGLTLLWRFGLPVGAPATILVGCLADKDNCGGSDPPSKFFTWTAWTGEGACLATPFLSLLVNNWIGSELWLDFLLEAHCFRLVSSSWATFCFHFSWNRDWWWDCHWTRHCRLVFSQVTVSLPALMLGALIHCGRILWIERSPGCAMKQPVLGVAQERMWFSTSTMWGSSHQLFWLWSLMKRRGTKQKRRPRPIATKLQQPWKRRRRTCQWQVWTSAKWFTFGCFRCTGWLSHSSTGAAPFADWFEHLPLSCWCCRMLQDVFHGELNTFSHFRFTFIHWFSDVSLELLPGEWLTCSSITFWLRISVCPAKWAALRLANILSSLIHLFHWPVMSLQMATFTLLMVAAGNDLGLFFGGAIGSCLHWFDPHHPVSLAASTAMIGCVPLWLSTDQDICPCGSCWRHFQVSFKSTSAWSLHPCKCFGCIHFWMILHKSGIADPIVKGKLQNVTIPELRLLAFASNNAFDDFGRGLGPVFVATLIRAEEGNGAPAFKIGTSFWIICGMLKFLCSSQWRKMKEMCKTLLQRTCPGWMTLWMMLWMMQNGCQSCLLWLLKPNEMTKQLLWLWLTLWTITQLQLFKRLSEMQKIDWWFCSKAELKQKHFFWKIHVRKLDCFWFFNFLSRLASGHTHIRGWKSFFCSDFFTDDMFQHTECNHSEHCQFFGWIHSFLSFLLGWVWSWGWQLLHAKSVDEMHKHSLPSHLLHYWQAQEMPVLLV